MSGQIDFLELAAKAMLFFVPFLFALCFHEFAHGFVARMKGDRTAETMGRLTLNPMSHADPIGTVIFPLVGFLTHIPLFGWAKPVPVDERNLKNPKSDMFWIAAAGPLSNLFLALVAAIGAGLMIRFFQQTLAADSGIVKTEVVMEFIKVFIQINVALALFNLIPIHPLDGGKVLARFLPDSINQKLEDMQMYTGYALMAIFLIGGFQMIAYPIIYVANLFFGLANQVAIL